MMIFNRQFADKKEKDEKNDKEGGLLREVAESFLKSRKIFLWAPVDDELAEKVVKQLIYLDSVSKEDITLLINSPGGVISSGLAIYDAMQAIKSDVATVVCGQAASMGSVLACAGAKGKRSAWKHSRIMIHQPLIHGHMFAPASDIAIQAEEMLRIRQDLNRIYSHHTGKTAEQIEKDTDRDNFLTAEEAKDYGLLDIVVEKI